MHKQLTPIAVFSLALVPALTVFDAAAGIVVNDPVDYTTAKVDPAGAEDIDGTVGPTYDLNGWNSQAQIYTIDFDQTGSFINGSQLDTVNLTALGQSITFSSNGYTTGQGFKVDNTAIRCTSGTQSIKTILAPVANDILTITFAKPVTGVAFTIMYEGNGVQVSYYDLAHNLLYAPSWNADGGDTTTGATWKDWYFTYQGNI
ncbi:MAG: hypothetical protein WC708_16195, partial [Lentisphaeria bacterium]